MKVLIITNYLGNKGGLGRYSSEVVKAMSKLPVSLRVLSESTSSVSSIEYNILKPVFNQGKIKLIFNFITNILKTRIIARDADIVHAHDGWPYAIYGFFAVLGSSKKLFVTGVGTYSVAPLRKGLRGFILKTAYRRCQDIFCISDYVRELILQLSPGVKTSVVFMGSTKLPTISKDQIAGYRRDFNLGEEIKPVILTVGDIKKRKGQFDTLKSLLLLKERYPKFRYIIIGSGDDIYYIDQIKKYIQVNNLENNVSIISNVYDDSVLSFYYSVCDIFMLNSNNDGDHFEGFGLVMLEAAQFGKPVIGSSGCGIENAMKDCYNGLLTEQGNHVDISEKIVDILEKDTAIFSENSKEFYKRFSWDITAKTYYTAYQASK